MSAQVQEIKFSKATVYVCTAFLLSIFVILLATLSLVVVSIESFLADVRGVGMALVILAPLSIVTLGLYISYRILSIIRCFGPILVVEEGVIYSKNKLQVVARFDKVKFGFLHGTVVFMSTVGGVKEVLRVPVVFLKSDGDVLDWVKDKSVAKN
jgi:hypothetical protein